MAKYKLIRDKQIFQIDEALLEVCDTRAEIISFSIKEIMNMLLELQQSDCRDIDLFADIFEILYNLAEESYIEINDIDELVDFKLEELGSFSKYLKRLAE